MYFLRIAGCIVFFAFACLHGALKAQGKINVPSVECLGNLTSFSYTPPSGLTLSSAAWDFGDGNGSSNLTPLHTYAGKGFYTIKINATFTNSTTRTDSVTIEVVGLPKAYFYLMPKSDSCLSTNFLKYRDTSRPAKAGQTITNRLFVWGDGNFDNTNSPGFGSILSYTYAVANVYTLRMDVTDKYGCKGSMTKTMTVRDNIEADAIVDTLFVDCNTSKICALNTSRGANVKKGSYKWAIDTSTIDTNAYLTSKKCIFYNKERTGMVIMSVMLNGFCPDTFRLPFWNRLDSLPTKITLLDSIWCWDDDGIFEFTADKQATCDKSNVRLNYSFPLPGCYPHFYHSTNPLCPSYPKSDKISYFLPKMSVMPGMTNVALVLYRGAGTCIVQDSFLIRGPVPDITIYDREQCLTERQVFFTEKCTYIDKKNAIYHWNVKDVNGVNCVSHRAKNINKYKNCNVSVDWYTKHKYHNPAPIEFVDFWIQDTVTGCIGTIDDNQVLFKKCPSIFNFDSVVLCQGDVFMNIQAPYPDTVTLDGGKTWKKFGFLLDSTYEGLYDVGFVLKTRVSPWAENWGDDSIKTHTDTVTYYDTIYKKKFLRVHPLKKDDFTLKIYGVCKPFRATLYLKNKVFLKGESLSVNWQDGISFGMTFKNDTIIDSVSHLYRKPGDMTYARIEIKTAKGCVWRKTIDIVFGKTFSLYIPDKNKLCSKKQLCMTATVLDFEKQYYWINDQTLGTRNLTWAFDDTSKYTNNFFPCHSFKNGGKQPVRMFLLDNFGCRDTIIDTVFIQDLKARVRYLSKTIYCSELKQFFDSSTFIKVKGDSIKLYSWSFGNGVYSSLVKNPLQVINTSMDSIRVTHAVTMVNGCTDTTEFYLKIIGPHPYFFIKDTIGCGSLNAVFLNRSKNCKSYLWEYGDPLSSTLQTNSKQDVNFNYAKPGRYYIYLTGYDTVFNPLTGKTFYCKNTFPDKLFQKDTTRAVLVLPFRTTGIQSRDTVCLGSPIVFTSLSDTAYKSDFWQMGDSTTYLKGIPSSVSHSYSKEGTYKVKLNPGYYFNDSLLNKFCRDSAQKDVLVVGVKADFDIDPLPIPPLFKFYNKSTPVSALLKWDFDHPSSGSNNNSTGQNTSHDYGNDTGRYNVCLIASIPEGCSDTICKTVYNDHLTEFQIFNVFTPGNADSKNDQYDILIEGESLYDLEIYNRWGGLVFKGDKDGDKTNDNNWNGKVNNKGEECPSGTYYFIFKYSLRTEPDNVKTLTGVVTLIR